MKRHIASALLLLAAIWFSYAQTGSFEHMRLDDQDYTFRCPFVRDGLSIANIREAFTQTRHAAIWMPVTYMSYMADISLFGPGPGPHHLVNVAIHSVNTILLAMLIFALAKRPQEITAIPCLAVAVWALHPQRTEAVAWVASRKELLWAMFTLVGLLSWRSRHGARPALATAGAYVCCALACMSKPTAMCFPLLAMVCEISSHTSTTSQAHSSHKPVEVRELCSCTIAYLPLVAMAAATGALAAYSQTHAEGYAARGLFSASLGWRLLNAAVAIGLYVFQTVLPAGIHLDYRAVPGQFPLHGILGLATLAGAIAAVLLARKNRRVLLATLWFLAALLPTLGIFGSFGEHARADRFLYVPAMAIAAMLAELRPCKAAAYALAAAAVALSAASWPVIASYRSDFLAFSRTLKFDPENGRALAHVGQAECAMPGGIDKGIAHLRSSQQLRQRDDTSAQLAYALMMRGFSCDHDEIRRLCAKFACDHSRDAKGQALEALGTTAMRQRRWTEAISCLEDSIRAPRRFYPDDDARLRLAACYCNSGRREDAEKTLLPLTQSMRRDIAAKARQALDALRRSSKTMLFVD